MNFKQDFFSTNRRKLVSRLDNQVIVISANGLLQSSGDMTFPFKQNSNFWYLTGINEPDAVLVINGSDEFIILPSRDKTRIVFDGDIDINLIAEISGISDVLAEKQGWQRLASLIKQAKSLCTVLPPQLYVKQAGLYTNPAAARLRKRLKSIKSDLVFNDLRQILADMRVIKQVPEIEAIQTAINITVDAFAEVFVCRQDYKFEYQLEAALENGFRSRGAREPAFPSIVASGQNACTLHYNSNNHKLNDEDLVLVDAGANYEHYSADLTRTFAIGMPTAQQQAVFDAVIRIQSFAIGLLKPGLSLSDYIKQVDECTLEELRSLELVKKNDQQALRKYFPHSVSHFLGLDVHDGRGWDKPLTAGMVLTVEPGIYIPQQGIGVRIEDNILITDDGNRILSAKLDKKLV